MTDRSATGPSAGGAHGTSGGPSGQRGNLGAPFGNPGLGGPIGGEQFGLNGGTGY